jgi:hypothetical protein
VRAALKIFSEGDSRHRFGKRRVVRANDVERAPPERRVPPHLGGSQACRALGRAVGKGARRRQNHVVLRRNRWPLAPHLARKCAPRRVARYPHFELAEQRGAQRRRHRNALIQVVIVRRTCEYV